jgi:hypothetical protein
MLEEGKQTMIVHPLLSKKKIDSSSPQGGGGVLNRLTSIPTEQRNSELNTIAKAELSILDGSKVKYRC